MSGAAFPRCWVQNRTGFAAADWLIMSASDYIRVLAPGSPFIWATATFTIACLLELTPCSDAFTIS